MSSPVGAGRLPPGAVPRTLAALALRAAAAMRAGARGYLLKAAAPDEVERAVRAVANGEMILGPQVAARAATHLLISKGPSADGSEKINTRVATMEPGDRTEEIARMLAGASITDEARAQAGRLLEAA